MSYMLNNPKIYTLSKPPSPAEPYLNTVRHSKLIGQFEKNGNTSHTINSEGMVDFYFLLPAGEDFERLADQAEEFKLILGTNGEIDFDIIYQEIEIEGRFHFESNAPLDNYSLRSLVKAGNVTVYYINYRDGKYVCLGLKTIQIPFMLRFDIQRYLTGKKPLLFPKFERELLPDKVLTKPRLLKNAWGYYLDLTAMANRVGNLEEASEIISRYILHSLASLQKSRHNHIMNDSLQIWVGRKISLNHLNQPAEYHCIYLAGNKVMGDPEKDAADKLFRKTLGELPEYEKTQWVSPLAEEGIPLAVMIKKKLFRLHITKEFYAKSAKLFQNMYQKQEGYVSHYEKMVIYRKENPLETKVYNILERRNKKNLRLNRLTLKELLELVITGREEDLPQIFDNLAHVKACDLDEIMVSLSEKYGTKIEPFLIPLLNSAGFKLKTAAMMGLGMIESVQAVPLLLERLCGSPKESSHAKYALAMIGDSVLPFLVPLLTGKKAQIRGRAVETLALIGTPQAISEIRNMKKDRSNLVEKAKKGLPEF